MTAQEFTIRNGTLAEMVNLMKEITAIENPGQWNAPAIEQYLRQSDIHLVAEYQGKVIGSVTAASEGMLGKNMPVLDFVNVLRPYHRNGIGSRLAVEAIRHMVAAGQTPIHCTVMTPESYSFIQSLPAEFKKHLRIETHIPNC